MKTRLAAAVAGLLIVSGLPLAHADAIDEIATLNTNRIGFMNLHPISSINVKLNVITRTVAPERLMALTKSVTSYAEFTQAMLRAAAEAEQREAWLEAALFYRGAEFYMTEDHQWKVETLQEVHRIARSRPAEDCRLSHRGALW